MKLLPLLKNCFGHTKTILLHKYYVAKYCFKIGLYWQGIVHDMSKFSPTEFLESIHYYTGTSSPINGCKKDKGYSMAWFHHRGRNCHHYEMWIDDFDHGGRAIPMPEKYIKEMICDYTAAAMTYLKSEFSWTAEYEWWVGKKQCAKMHDKTIEVLDRFFVAMATAEKFGELDDDTFEKVIENIFEKNH